MSDRCIAACSELSRKAAAAGRIWSGASLCHRLGVSQRCGGSVSARPRLAVRRVPAETARGAACRFRACLSFSARAAWWCVLSAGACIDVLVCAMRARVTPAVRADARNMDASTSSCAGVGDGPRGAHRRCIVERRQDSRSAARRLLSARQDIG